MLLHVTATEMQYRLESEIRDRDLARLALMRERQDALAAEAAAAPARPRVPGGATARLAGRARATWARPIGMQSHVPCPCPAV